jgi:TonB-linked SusC/RagA family outer membrane protein
MKKIFSLRQAIYTCMRNVLMPVILIAGASVIAFANTAGGQEILTKKISLSVDQVEMKVVLKEIGKKAEVGFIYSAQKIPVNKLVSCKAENEMLGSILNRLLNPAEISYEVKGNKIILMMTRDSALVKNDGSMIENNDTGIVVNPASKKQITGKVTDENGRPLSLVSIKVKGSKTVGTTTDINGVFSIEIPDNATLIISYVGYETKEIKTEQLNTVSVKMKPAAGNKLDDVIIIGSQKQSFRKSTAAVQVISGKTIENLPAPSFEQLLQGRVTGINIQNFSGEPGVRNTFTVRGNSTLSTDLNTGVDEANTLSTPLYVVDGIPLSINDLEGISSSGTNMLAGININDIESVVIEKDAAATAAWGSRGGNGVVIIKTKRGKPGKPVFRLSYYTGITQRPQLITTVTGAEERDQKLGLMYLYGGYQNLSDIPQVLSDSLNPAFNNATDWQDLFYKTGKVNNADLSISAGNDLINYRIGVNYYDEGGVIRNTGFKRYSFRGNFDFKISPKVNLIVNLSKSILDRKRGLGRGRSQVTPINGVSQPASFYRLSDADKIFYYGQYDKLRDKNTTDILSSYLQMNYDIANGIQYSLQASYSTTNDRRDLFQPTEITPDHRNYAESDNGTYTQTSLNNILSLAKSFKNNTHNIGIVFTQATQLDQQTGTFTGGNNVPDDNIQVVSGIPQRDIYGYSIFKKAGLLSFLGQLSYDYKEKYIINASFRSDASSRFGKNTKTGYFKSISASWIASEESLIKNINWINLLKFRVSYGTSGTLPDDFNAPFNVWNVSQGTYNGITIATPSFTKPIALPNLTWNKSEQLNIGADIYLFHNRLNITLDAYRRTNDKSIGAFPFPFYTGYTTLTYNAPVRILNEGIELQIQSRNLRPNSKLQWTTNISISYNKNRLAALPNGGRTFYGDSRGFNYQIGYVLGQSIYSFYQMRYQGVYNTIDQIPVNPLTGSRITYFKYGVPVRPGFPIWQDINKDWDVWPGEDRGDATGDITYTGNPNPKYIGGISNEFTFKNFSLGIYGTFTIGRDIINTFESNQFAGIWNFGNPDLRDFANQRLPDLSRYNYWTPPGSIKDGGRGPATFPSLNPYGPNYYQFLTFSTLWNDNGSYFRLKTITLGYNLDKKLSSLIGVQGIRFYGVLDNIHIFQKARVPDAELVSPQGDYTGSAYPIPKKVTFGVEVTF